ncbi:MAG: hypothetical protein KDK36_05110 [Leptospiraceae bacterium]|nr:hypothetical protein [Leptospiraceae bacterium]
MKDTLDFNLLAKYLKGEVSDNGLPSLGHWNLDMALEISESYFEEVKNQSESSPVDVDTAGEILDRIKKLIPIMKSKDEKTLYKFYLTVLYYIQVEDDFNDLESSDGFDDDAEIMNLFLKNINSSLPLITIS